VDERLGSWHRAGILLARPPLTSDSIQDVTSDWLRINLEGHFFYRAADYKGVEDVIG
jgi:hypothetical protein